MPTPTPLFAEPAVDGFQTLTAADNGNTIAPGKYLLDTSGGAFGVLLEWVSGQEWDIRDTGNASNDNVTFGTTDDSFNLGDGPASGPLTIDIEQIKAGIVADPSTPDLYHIHLCSGLTAPPPPPEQLTATLPFAM